MAIKIISMDWKKWKKYYPILKSVHVQYLIILSVCALYWFPHLIVVYFDQQTHACACIRMVENDKKH